MVNMYGMKNRKKAGIGTENFMDQIIEDVVRLLMTCKYQWQLESFDRSKDCKEKKFKLRVLTDIQIKQCKFYFVFNSLNGQSEAYLLASQPQIAKPSNRFGNCARSDRLRHPYQHVKKDQIYTYFMCFPKIIYQLD